MNKLHKIQISIKLLSPWLVHGNDPGRYGLDAVQLLGPNNERLIPGSLLLGRIRESCQEMGGDFLSTSNDWFGKEAESYEPVRSKVWIADLLEQVQNPTERGNQQNALPMIRVSLNENTQAGEEGMLQFIEQLEPTASEIVFRGDWHVRFTAEKADEIKKTIHVGLALHSQLGAYRNIGFGKLLSVTVTLEEVPNNTQHQAQALNTRPAFPIDLALSFDTPLAVGNRLINGNIFVSDTVISGATLKGALATLWADDKPHWFDALHIASAMPSSNEHLRALPIPLSWAVSPNNDALVDTTHTGKALDASCTALAFQPDWKPRHFTQANQRLGLGATRRYQRVRTAIEEGRAKQGQLFAYQMVLAEDETRWLSHCRLGGEYATENNYKDLWARLLSLQNQGWGPIGKTDAFAHLTLLPSKTQQSQDVASSTDLAFMLASDGGILASQDLCKPNDQPPDLQGLYQSAWHDIAQQLGITEPTLLRCFVQHRPMGGEYLAHRFIKPSDEKPYLPRFLTQAGSVFVLRFPNPSAAQQALERLQQQAFLPLTGAVKTLHGHHWQYNPYLPENGFGEIALMPTLASAMEHSTLGATA